MRILESQPERYDRGIRWLSYGRSERVKRRVVAEHVTPGSRVLDIGCGTGTLAVLAISRTHEKDRPNVPIPVRPQTPAGHVSFHEFPGIATPRKSDAEQLLLRIHCNRLGTVFREKAVGTITLQRDTCNGCGICRAICPLGVFGEFGDDHKVTFRDRDACFNWAACVKQCPESALTLSVG